MSNWTEQPIIKTVHSLFTGAIREQLTDLGLRIESSMSQMINRNLQVLSKTNLPSLFTTPIGKGSLRRSPTSPRGPSIAAGFLNIGKKKHDERKVKLIMIPYMSYHETWVCDMNMNILEWCDCTYKNSDNMTRCYSHQVITWPSNGIWVRWRSNQRRGLVVRSHGTHAQAYLATKLS